MRKKSFEKFHKLKETEFMAVGAKWRRSLQIEECNFSEPALNFSEQGLKYPILT